MKTAVNYLIIFTLLLLNTGISQAQIRIMPLGNSLTYEDAVGYTKDSPDSTERIAYRLKLYELLDDAGYSFQYVGNRIAGTDYLPAGQDSVAAWPGIRDNHIDSVISTGTSSFTGTVTPGPYLESYPADIILLHIGTNDLYYSDFTSEDADSILSGIYSTNPTDVIVFLAQIISKQHASGGCTAHGDVNTFNNNLATMVSSRISDGDNLVFVKMQCQAGINYNTEMVDTWHPTVSGYNKMAQMWFNAIDSFNLAPVVSNIPGESINEGESFATFDLDDYVTDDIDPDADINWTFDPVSPVNLNVFINPTTHVVTVSPKSVDWFGSESITFIATDKGRVLTQLQKSASDIATFTVNDINYAPTDIILSSSTITENLPVTSLVGFLSTVDPDAGDSHIYSLVSGFGSTDNDSFNIDVNQLRSSVEFNYEAKSTYSIRIQTDDGNGGTYQKVFPITVTDINDPPVLSNIETTPITYEEDDPPVRITNTLAAEDEDSGDNIEGAIIIINSGGYDGSEDTLIYTGTLLSDSWNQSGGTLTLTGSQSPITYQTELHKIYYYNKDTVTPTESIRTITFQINDGTALSNAASRNISVGRVNDPPILSNIGTSPVTYTENAGDLRISSTITVDDPENNFINYATVQIISGSEEGDTLYYNSTQRPTTWFPGSHTLRIEGPVNEVQMQSAIRLVYFRNTITENPPAGSRIVEVKAYDIMGGVSLGLTKTINVVPVNDIPVLTLGTGTFIYTEKDPPLLISPAATITDVDNDSLTQATIQIATNYHSDEDTLRFTDMFGITGSWNNTNGTLTLTGGDTKAHYQTAIRSIAYYNRDTLNPYSGNRNVNYRLYDGTGWSTTVTRIVGMALINDPPLASNVTISGAETVFAIQTGSFDYTDPEGDPIGTHQHSWFRYQNLDMSDSAAISGAIQNTYVPGFADGGYYLRYKVKPADNKGAIAPIAYPSPWKYINAAPVASNLQLIGNIALDQTVTATFTYTDLEANPKANSHYYRWYRSLTGGGDVGSLINQGYGDSTYTIQAIDENYYLRFEISPRATAGSLIGDTVSSPWRGPISVLPTATISNIAGITDSICGGGLDSAALVLSFTGENAPWTVTYTRNGSNPQTLTVFINDTTITTKLGGIYALTNVSDTAYSTGIVSGSATVVVRALPNFLMQSSSPIQICNDGVTLANIRYELIGTAPWTLSYTRNDTIQSKSNILTSIDTIKTMLPGQYRFMGVNDKHCYRALLPSPPSALVAYRPSPTATLGAVTSAVCQGDTVKLPVTLTGSGPWNLLYTINGVDSTFASLTEYQDSLEVTQQGTYEIVYLQDLVCTGKATGTGSVTFFASPTANISGNETICEFTTTTLPVNLTGAAPWSVVYQLDSNPPDTVPVLTPSYQLEVADSGTYNLVSVNDINCPGSVSGTGYINILEAPEATIKEIRSAYQKDEPIDTFYVNPGGGSFNVGFAFNLKDTTCYFFPSIAYDPDMPEHEVIYQWRDPGTTCYGYDTTTVYVIETNTDISASEPGFFSKVNCYNQDTVILTGINILNPSHTGSFTISGGIGLVDQGNNTAIVYPSMLTTGTYTVRYNYYVEGELHIDKDFDLEYLDPVYFEDFNAYANCSNDDQVLLESNMDNGVFSGNPVFISGLDYYFDPALARIGQDTVFLSYTSPNNCTRDTFEIVITDTVPKIDFMVDDLCLQSGDTTQFINLTVSADSVISWLWNFDHPQSLENTSTEENPKHLFPNSDRRDVMLTASTNKNCSASRQIPMRFGEAPTVIIGWQSECFTTGQAIQFEDQTISNTLISEYAWKIYDNTSIHYNNSQNPSYTFSEEGTYDVELKVTTEVGCADSTVVQFNLRPTYHIADSAYEENFESDPLLGWDTHADKSSEANSWTLGLPIGNIFSGAYSGANAWYTYIIDRQNQESSWVTSPCFNFENTRRPMIKMEIWRAFEQTRDGSVLQYTTDNGRTWSNVGRLNDGITWYNSSEITSLPGDLSIGWSLVKDTRWNEARHDLDVLKDTKNVQFRIAYGSDGTGITNEGFAFDDIWIGERNKKTLVEHFTNANDDLSNHSNNLLDDAMVQIDGDALDIQYHTSYPSPDEFNLDNQNDPFIRGLVYGISSSPYTVLNGDKADNGFDFISDSIEAVDIKKQSLEDAEFGLSLSSVRKDNSMDIEAEIVSLKDFSSTEEITLHLAVVETAISTPTWANPYYRSVLKALVPTAAGTTYTRKWSLNETATVNYTWNHANVYEKDSLMVIAFLQNENTKEIYQAASDRDDIVTGMDVKEISNEISYLIYPNPTIGLFNIQLSAPQQDLKVYIFNSIGELSVLKEYAYVEDGIAINISHLQKGIYIVRLLSGESVIQNIKLIKSR